MYTGGPKQFLDWILKVEKVAQLTGRPEWDLATARADDAVFKCLSNIPKTMSWEECKRILRENFLNLQTKTHASVHLMAKAQRPDESLQEYIYQFSELVKMVMGLEPIQVTDPLKIIIFNKHLFN